MSSRLVPELLESVPQSATRRLIGVELRIRVGLNTEELGVLPCDIAIPRPGVGSMGYQTILTWTLHTTDGDSKFEVHL